ncbi:MAG TPA: lmo0937 family membrane protein [Gemmatimonadota bacterium]|nr:lmo0937 family membrane protein [Gemmatimonadota bacterium]
MLWTIIVILLILWLLGAFVRPMGGGFIHLLLVIVLILAILQLV